MKYIEGEHHSQCPQSHGGHDSDRCDCPYHATLLEARCAYLEEEFARVSGIASTFYEVDRDKAKRLALQSALLERAKELMGDRVDVNVETEDQAEWLADLERGVSE